MPRTATGGIEMIKLQNKSNGRFYYIRQESDLFDEKVLVVIRGGIKNNHCVRYVISNDFNNFVHKINSIIKIRIKRGYEIMESEQWSIHNL